MTDTFPLAMQWLGPIEGEYTDDPNDKGNWTSGEIGIGELKGTKYGISAAYLHDAHPELEVKDLTKAQVRELYRADFWDRYRCGELPPAIGLCLFDAAVQHRPSTAVMMLQHAVGAQADGVIGPKTIARARKAKAEEAVIDMLQARLKLYRGLAQKKRSFATFIDGWETRVLRLQAFIYQHNLLEAA